MNNSQNPMAKSYPIGHIIRNIFDRQDRGNRAKILAIAGCTCTGKTTLSKQLQQEIQKSGLTAKLLGQDDFYKRKEEVRILHNKDDQKIIFYDYDQPEALHQDRMLNEVRNLSASSEVLIVEGNMITDLDLIEEIDYILFLTIDKEDCRARRLLRIYDPPDAIGYFDQVVWPCYEQTYEKIKALKKAGQRRIAFLNSAKQISLDEVVAEFQHLICDRLEFAKNRMDAEAATKWVNSPACGATSVFIGTTRDTFNNKPVKHLEYEAYEEMAYAEMASICKEVRRKHPTVLKICIMHRRVPIGEASVIIASSSPQRKAAIEATGWLIDSLKERVPIWKKEFYADGSCSWKENVEQPKKQ